MTTMDGYLRQVNADLQALKRAERRLWEHQCAHIVFKPEALHGRVVELAIAFLQRNGFEAHCAVPFTFSRLHVPLLWQHALGGKSLEWLDWLDIHFDQRQGLCVGLRAVGADAQSAVDKLAALKPALRTLYVEHAEQRANATPVPHLYNYFHCADGVQHRGRELAILLGSKARRRMLSASVCDQGSLPVLAALEHAYGQASEHDLSVDRALRHFGLPLEETRSKLESHPRQYWFELRSAHPSCADKAHLSVIGAAFLTAPGNGPAQGATPAGEPADLPGAASSTSSDAQSPPYPRVRDHYLQLSQEWISRAPRTAWTDRLTYCILKPESFATSAASLLLNRIINSGYKPVAWRRLVYDRSVMRVLWEHRLTEVSVIRLDAIDYLGEFPRVLLIVFQSTLDTQEPASTRLNGLKGKGDPQERKPGDHRWQLPVEDRLLNFVHYPDGPEAMVAELTTLFDAVSRDRLVGEAQESIDCHQGVRGAIDEVNNEFDSTTLGWEPTLRRLSAKHDFPPQLLSSLRAGKADAWGQFLEASEQSSLPIGIWDIIMTGARLATLDNRASTT